MATPSRGKTILVWCLTIPLFLMMMMTGSNKFSAAEVWTTIFTDIGAPLWLMPVAGVVEIVAAVLLLVPPLAALGAAALSVTMLTATGFNLFGGQPISAISTGVFMVIAASIALLRKERFLRGRET